MAIYKTNIVDIDLNKGKIQRSPLNYTIGSGDDDADRIGIRVFRGKEPVDLTGVAVQGVFMPPQGSPIAITTGNIVYDNVALVVLPQACYNYHGQFCLAIKLVSVTEGITGTMRIVDGMVDNTHTIGTVAPTSAVPTYQEVLAVYEDAIAAVEDVNEFKSALINELNDGNAFDILQFCNHPTHEHREVQFTWNDENNACTVLGTATGGAAVDTFFDQAYAFPKGVSAGSVCRLKYSATNVKFQAYAYIGGVLDTTNILASITSNKDFTVPSNASGLFIRLAVSSGATANETVSPKLFTETPTNEELNSSTINLAENMTANMAGISAVLGRNEMNIPWIKHAYIHETTGEVIKTDSDVSVTGLIPVPFGSKAIIATTSTSVRYATYNKNGELLNVYSNAWGINIVISSESVAYFRFQYNSVTDLDLATVHITFEYDNEIAEFSNEYATKTGNPICIDNASESKLPDISYSSAGNDEIINLCGKNLFHFQHKSKLGMVQNGVTFHFNMTTQEMSIESENGATGTTLSANSTFDGGCTTLDGVAAYHNFHFKFNEDTEVTVTPNYSVDPFYDSKVLLFVIWVEDNAIKSLPIGYEGATIVAQAGVEYGIRVRVTEGFTGSLTLKPQVEIGGKSTVFEQYNGAECLLDSGEGSANVFDMTQKNRLISTFASNKITAEWLYLLKSVKITSDNPASATVVYHPDYDGTVNGNAASYIFKFTPGNVPVCVAGVPEKLVGLAIIQIVDGTNTINIRTADPYLFVAETNKEYGYRVYINAGSIFDYTLNPVIATGLEALKLFGSKHPITNVYTDGNASLSVKYTTETEHDKEQDAGEIAKGINILTAGKIVHPFEKLKKFPPVITFIDDDTTSPTLVERFHDILAAENVVGNYAVEMRNVENYQDTMPDLLLGYEQEGFGMLYHCYKQDGDSDRYWESGNPAYDEELIRENFYKGLRAYRQMGFNSDKYWVTPYGVNDEFIRSLAKEADMECLLSCPTATYACNAIMNLGSNISRWNMPRFIFLSDTNNDYQARALIDGCAESNGWLCIVTHVNSWPSAMVETNTQRLTDLIQYIKSKDIEIWNFNRAFQTFKPLLMLNELF